MLKKPPLGQWGPYLSKKAKPFLIVMPIKKIMFTTCFKCKKQNDYWESHPLKEPITLNGQVLAGAFGATKYFCPISERKVRNGTLSENQEKVLITDCLNGDRAEIREKLSLEKT